MFTPHDRLTPAPVRRDELCMCGHGGACSSFAPGHAVHLIQARLVSATPAEWVDVIVTDVDRAQDRVRLHTLEGESLSVWNGAGLTDAVEPGTPVAYHPRYHAVSVGQRLFNALELR